MQAHCAALTLFGFAHACIQSTVLVLSHAGMWALQHFFDVWVATVLLDSEAFFEQVCLDFLEPLVTRFFVSYKCEKHTRLRRVTTSVLGPVGVEDIGSKP